MADWRDPNYKVGPGHPPVSGMWKPGQSGNPKGRPVAKPFKEALNRLRQRNPALDDEIASALAAKAITGDVAALKELADRLDGKVPQSVGGAAELGAVTVRWALSDDDERPALTDETGD